MDTCQRAPRTYTKKTVHCSCIPLPFVRSVRDRRPYSMERARGNSKPPEWKREQFSTCAGNVRTSFHALTNRLSSKSATIGGNLRAFRPTAVVASPKYNGQNLVLCNIQRRSSIHEPARQSLRPKKAYRTIPPKGCTRGRRSKMRFLNYLPANLMAHKRRPPSGFVGH